MTIRSLWLGLSGAAIVAAAGLSSPTGADPAPAARPAPQRSVQCDGAIQHPLHVQLTRLDPVGRGAAVRVRLAATSRAGLDRGEARLVSAGGAEVTGPTRVPLGRLTAGREARADFAVRLPADGRRVLLQFRVTGEGRNGLESRGATLNLLPDGPADAGRVITSDAGQRITEYRARRVVR